MKSLLILIPFLTFVIIACDRLDEDTIPQDRETIELQDEVFSLPNTSVYFDLKKSLNLAGDGALRAKVLPEKGNLDLLEQGFVRYTPKTTFKSGTDFFVMEALSSSGISLHSDTINITMVGDTTELPCFNGALSDYVSTYQNQSVTVNVIKNDGYCKDETSGAIIEIITEPKNGEVTLTDLFTYTYYPNQGFSGRDSLVYSLELVDLNGESYFSTAMVNFEVKSYDDTCHIQLYNDFFSFEENSSRFSLDIIRNDYLCDSSDYIVSIVEYPANAEAVVYYPENSSTPKIYYYPFTNATQYQDSLIYSVMGENEILHTAKVAIEINIDECQLRVNDDFYELGTDSLLNGQNNFVELDVMGNDNICEWLGLEYGVSGNNSSIGSATFSGTLLQYSPEEEFVGSDTVKYLVCEGATCETGNVVIEVQ